MDNPVSIQVCGDLLLDFGLLRISKEPAPFHSDALERVNLRITRGGAWYLADVLNTAFASELSIASPHRPNLPGEIPEAANLSRAYQAWERFPDPSSKDKDAKVWRVKELMGCTVSKQPFINEGLPVDPPNILVIDDLALGFAKDPRAWPKALTNETPPSEIVLKTSGVFVESELWKKCLKSAWAKHLTVVLPAHLLRRRGAALLQGLSWDRALDELDRELIEGVSASDLGKCRRVVVAFQDEAAAVFVQKGEGGGLTFDRMIFDPDAQEGAWKATRPGRVFGGLSLLTASVVRQLAEPGTYPLNLALARGLKAGRISHQIGGGSGKEFEEKTVHDEVKATLQPPKPPPNTTSAPEPMDDFVVTRAALDPANKPFGFVSRGTDPKFGELRVDLLRDAAGDTRSAMLATALDVVIRGPEKALHFAPKARYGDYVTADREEIERINSIRNLVLTYIQASAERRPLSIAVFGAPGCGKSFAVKQLISTIFPKDQQEKPLVFNLSEFLGEDDLAEAFHEIRDLSQRGRMPLVFWDEFDSKYRGQELGWLKSFLAPMQDSEFRARGRVHPLGRALFIFAGGTCRNYADFTAKASSSEYADCKITDFLSRLRGYIDIKGPNPYNLDKPDDDPAHVIRRALLLNLALKERCPHVLEQGALGVDVISALLQVGEFRHGARSAESLVAMCQTGNGAAFTAAALPPPELMNLHIADDDFAALFSRAPLDVAVIEHIADCRHEAWRKEREDKGWTLAENGIRDDGAKKHPRLMPHAQLKEAWKEDNRRPARLTYDYLSRLGYLIQRQPANGSSMNAITEFPPDVFAKLVDHEHVIWMRSQWLMGYDLPESKNVAHLRSHSDHVPTDDLLEGKTVAHLRLHADLIPTKDLISKSSDSYKLDAAIINALPKALATKGWEIVPPKQSPTSAPQP